MHAESLSGGNVLAMSKGKQLAVATGVILVALAVKSSPAGDAGPDISFLTLSDAGQQSAEPSPRSTEPASTWVHPIAKKDYKGIEQCWDRKSERGRHAGVDFNVANVPALAANHGTVSDTGYNRYGGYYIIVKHQPELYFVYEHLKKGSILFKEGEIVKPGERVATTGNTGERTTGSHLHFGISVDGTMGSYGNNSMTRNPLNYLPDDGRDISPCKRTR
jgi:murein DD-endopeptidase MepM/ murein hydrolase activator NlpD